MRTWKIEASCEGCGYTETQHQQIEHGDDTADIFIPECDCEDEDDEE